MESIAVIFWSGTGNTATMAQEVVAGTGGQAKLINVTDINADEAAAYDKLALGCPSMGDEVLEEDEMEPFFTALEGKISGKKVVLFGSYDWGDGQWMRDWAERTKKVENIVATVNQDAPQISLYQSVWLRAHDAKLQGVVCSATGYIDWNRVYWAE